MVDVYMSTMDPTDWPPGCKSQRTARRRIEAAGGRKVGAAWTISRERYMAWLEGAPVASTTPDAIEADIRRRFRCAG